MYESKHHAPIARALFVRRLLGHFLAATGLLAASLIVGMAGYEYFEHLAWRDAFINSAMLLGGMGPVNSPQSDGGKIFAGLYALYAGLVFLIVLAVIFTPVIHRVLHTFHWEEGE
jgi:hypothetical protein